MIMSLQQRKIKFEPRIKLNHNIYTLRNGIKLQNDKKNSLLFVKVLFFFFFNRKAMQTVIRYRKQKRKSVIMFFSLVGPFEVLKAKGVQLIAK